MKSEKLLDAMGDIDLELVSAALEPPAERARRPKITWARVAIAACLCLALAFPVGALMDSLGVRFQFRPEEDSWSADIDGRIPVSSLSKEAQELADGQVSHVGHYAMDSMAEAEGFLGVPLPHNPLLEGAMKMDIHTELADGEELEAHCMVCLCNNQKGDLVAVWAEAWYKYRGLHVQELHSMVTDLNPYANGGGVGVSDAEGATQPETHITPSGRECTVVLVDAGHGWWDGYGYVAVDSALTQLVVWGKDREQTRSVLTQLLDAYE